MEGLLRYMFGGLLFGGAYILGGGAYFWNFMVIQLSFDV